MCLTSSEINCLKQIRFCIGHVITESNWNRMLNPHIHSSSLHKQSDSKSQMLGKKIKFSHSMIWWYLRTFKSTVRGITVFIIFHFFSIFEMNREICESVPSEKVHRRISMYKIFFFCPATLVDGSVCLIWFNKPLKIKKMNSSSSSKQAQKDTNNYDN